jgi:hypothetical protein
VWKRSSAEAMGPMDDWYEVDFFWLFAINTDISGHAWNPLESLDFHLSVLEMVLLVPIVIIALRT